MSDEALEDREKKSGKDHPATLNTLNNLAALYKEQARYDNTEQLLLEGAEGRLKLGDTHPHTLESWKNLIDLHEVRNKPEKAEDFSFKRMEAAI